MLSPQVEATLKQHGTTGRRTRPSTRAAEHGLHDATWARARGWALALSVMFLAHSADNPSLAAVGHPTGGTGGGSRAPPRPGSWSELLWQCPVRGGRSGPALSPLCSPGSWAEGLVQVTQAIADDLSGASATGRTPQRGDPAPAGLAVLAEALPSDP